MRITTLLGLAMIAVPAMAVTQNANGVYQISNAAELEEFAAIVNGGQNTVNAVLTDDIDMDGVTHTPIGNKATPYKGTFDGQFHEISCLEMGADTEGEGLALFGNVGAGAVLKNCFIDDLCEFKGIDNIAAFAAMGSDTEEGWATFICLGNHANVTATSVNESRARAAGIVGPANDNISYRFENCYNVGTVWGGANNVKVGVVGGMSCDAHTAICHNCFSSTTVKIHNKDGNAANPNPVGQVFITGVVNGGTETWKYNFFIGSGPVFYPNVTDSAVKWQKEQYEAGEPYPADTTWGVYKVNADTWQNTGAMCWYLNNCNETDPVWGQDLDSGEIWPTFKPGSAVVVKKAGAFEFENNGAVTPTPGSGDSGVNELDATVCKGPQGIFNMQGVKLEKATTPGLYIIDGKKVLVK